MSNPGLVGQVLLDNV
jgi:hypothetical protein